MRAARFGSPKLLFVGSPGTLVSAEFPRGFATALSYANALRWVAGFIICRKIILNLSAVRWRDGLRSKKLRPHERRAPIVVSAIQSALHSRLWIHPNRRAFNQRMREDCMRDLRSTGAADEY